MIFLKSISHPSKMLPALLRSHRTGDQSMQRNDPELADYFRKDPADEEFLEKLNSILCPHEECSYEDIPETLPTLHIVGVPRSGTTLVSQLISNHLSVGYINNLIAAFWKAPVIGIRLSKKLHKGARSSTFTSEFGRTNQIWEPHEFGYFWAQHLHHAGFAVPEPAEIDAVDWVRFRKIINNMCSAFGQPTVFKSVLLGGYIERVVNVFQKACVLHIRRDPVDNALSLLKYRREFLGNVDSWVSVRPREYSWLKELSVEEQVAGQVHFLEATFAAGLSAWPADRVLEVSYEDLCANPQAVLQATKELLNRHGGEVEMIGAPPTFQRSRTSTESKTVVDNISRASARFQHEVANEFFKGGTAQASEAACQGSAT